VAIMQSSMAHRGWAVWRRTLGNISNARAMGFSPDTRNMSKLEYCSEG